MEPARCRVVRPERGKVRWYARTNACPSTSWLSNSSTWKLSMSNHVETQRLIGQELSSVTVSTNSIRLQFVAYPLATNWQFRDAAVVEIEHGYEIASDQGAIAVFQGDGLVHFRHGACGFLYLIEKSAKAVNIGEHGELVLIFSDDASVRLPVSCEGFDTYHIHLAPLRET